MSSRVDDASTAVPPAMRGLRVRDLTVTDADGGVLLADADVQAPPGLLVALRGPSGCGKSTLLHAALGALSGGLRITAGAASWEGVIVPTGRAARRWRRTTVGYCAQEAGTSLHPRRTVLSLVMEAAGGGGGDADVQTAHVLLARLGLPLRLHDRLAQELSGGQAQRVAFARASLTDPPLLVADEPTRGLDGAAAALVHELLQERRRAGSVTLVVTHDDQLARAADVVIEMGRAGPGPAPAVTTGVRRGTDEVVLALRGVSLAQPPGCQVLVRGAELEVRAGERVALLGASGSGKSTLLRAIAGLHPAEEGEVRLGGRVLGPAGRRSRDERRALQLMGQDPQGELNPAHRARAAVIRPLRLLRRLSRPEAEREADALLRGLGICAATARRWPAALSGGERQRVSLARALAAAPRVLLADEPTAALDATSAAALTASLDRLQDDGIAVLLATHDEALAAKADRRVRIIGGALVPDPSSDA